MANTPIQIKRSLTSNTPATLNIGEPAYSYSSNTLFIGSPAETGAIPIGGYDSYIRGISAYDKLNTAHNHANSAYVRANNALNANVGGLITGDVVIQGNLSIVGGSIGANVPVVLIGDNIISLNTAISPSGEPTMNAGIEIDRGAQPNVYLLWNETDNKWQFTNDGVTYDDFGGSAASSYANSAFVKANSAFLHANYSFNHANSGFIQANSAFLHANFAFANANAGLAMANAAYIHANSGFIQANSSFFHVNAAYLHANAAYTSQNTSGIRANSAFEQANAAFFHANSAFQFQNTSGNYANSGFIQANSAYHHANAAFANANGAFAAANAAYIQANSAFIQTNAAFIHANSGFIKTNSAFDHANAAFANANGAFARANAAFANANGAFAAANAAYIQANSGFIQSNAAFNHANAGFIRANNSLNANVGGQVTGDVVIVGNLTSNTLTTTGSNGSITGANAIFSNYFFGANGTVDLYVYTSYAFANANGAFARANAAFANANGAFAAANAAYIQANSAFIKTNAAFDHANAAYISQNATGQYANAAFIWANAAYNQANTDKANLVNSGFTAQLHSNGAFALPGTLIFGPSKGRITNQGDGVLSITANAQSGNTGIYLDNASQAVLYGKTSVLIQTNQGLFDSPTRSFTFTQDGTITLPASRGDIGRSGFPNGIDLYNNNGGAGYVRMNFADESVMWVDPGGAHIQTTGTTSNTWDFGTDGQIRFPDSTKQFTAFIGYGIDNVARDTSNSAFIRANNSLDANLGGTVTANVVIDANLTTQNVFVGSYIDLNTSSSVPPRNEGRIFYDNDQKTLAYNNESDNTIQLGQETVIRVWNNSGTTIDRGKVARIGGDASANGFPAVALASADIAANAEVVGVTSTAIANNDYGYVTIHGKIRGLNTSLLAAGQELFLSDTPGEYQTTPPVPPSIPMAVGYVTLSDVTDGSILVYSHLMEGKNKTNGAILFGRNGAIDQDPTKLYWDYANDRLGIDTDSPQANLHVAGDGLFTGNLTITGNLVISNAQTITTDQLFVGGNNVILSANVTGTPTLNAAIIVNRGSSPNAYILWDETVNEWLAYEGSGEPGHIILANKTANSWAVYDTFEAYEKEFYPIGANLANSTNEHAKAGFATANIAENLATASFKHANSGFIQANSSYVHANAAYLSQNATGQYANAAFIHANSAYQSQNATGQYANAAFTVANGAFIHTNSAFGHANAAYQSQNATGQYANAAFIHANSGYIHVNSAFDHANAAYISQNSTGNYANAAFANANAGLAMANAAFANANGAFASANAAFNTGNSAFIQANASFDHANAAFAAANNVFPQVQPAYDTANSAFIHANASFDKANTADQNALSAGSYANSAFVHANAAFASANNVAPQVQPAFNTANAAFIQANASFITANNADANASSAGVYANGAYAHANAAFAAANNVAPQVQPAFHTANAAFIQANAGILHAQSAFHHANAGFDAANTADDKAVTASNRANAAFIVANATTIQANAGFDHANSGFVQANSAFFHANSGFIQANASYNQANASFIVANATSSQANAAFDHANAAFASANNVAPQVQPAFNTANSAFIQANAGILHAQSAFNHANSGFIHANSSYVHANAAFNAANNASDPWVRGQANAAFIQANAAFDKANTGANAEVTTFNTTSNGAVSTYALGFTPASNSAVIVSIGGIVQTELVDYIVTRSNNSISFNEPPPAGQSIRVAGFNNVVPYFLDIANSAGAVVSTYSAVGDGSTQAFSIGFRPESNKAIFVSIGGILQPETAYTVTPSTNTVTFVTAPGNNENIRIVGFEKINPYYIQYVSSNVSVSVFETISTGTTATFNLGFNPQARETLIVTIDGIVQSINDYTVNTALQTITLDEIPANGELVRVATMYTTANAFVIPDGSITSQKLSTSLNTSIQSAATTGKAIAMSIVFGG